VRVLPLTLVTAGLAFVALDLRVVSTDVAPDPVGWALIALGAWRLGRRGVAGAAVLTALTTTAEVVLPYRYALIDGDTGQEVRECVALHVCYEQLRIDPVVDERLWLLALGTVTGGFVLAAILLGLRGRARELDDDRATARLGILAVAVTVGWTTPLVVGIAAALASRTGRYDPVWNGTAEYAYLLGALSLGWMAVELALAVRRRWAMPPGHEEASPWARARPA
jgi:hypothetical protein